MCLPLEAYNILFLSRFKTIKNIFISKLEPINNN